jgi:hypothetical protein
MALLRYVFELYLGGSWVDITSHVRHQKVTIKRGTTDESPKLTPGSASLTLDNSDDRFNPDNPTGPYYGLLIRNTPIRISCAGGVSDPYRFWGEVFAFSPRWNEDRSDCTVPIEANGALRRIISRHMTPRSYYRSWVNNHTLQPTPKFFWALEEGADAGAGGPDIGSGGAWLTNTPANGAAWGQAKMNDWLPNGIKVDNLNTLNFPADMRSSTSSAWELTCFLTFPNNETTCQFEIDCAIGSFFVQLGNNSPDWTGATAVVILPNGTASVAAIAFNLRDVSPLWLTFRVDFTGSAIRAFLSLAPVGRPTDTVSVAGVGSYTAPAMIYPRAVRVSASANTVTPGTATTNFVGLSALSLSECSVSTANFNLSYVASKGAPGEMTYDRFARLCSDSGLLASWFTSGGVAMGRQYNQKLEDHFLEILASSKHSGIIEAPDTGRLLLLPTGFDRGTLDYGDLTGDLEPTSDDQVTVNILDVTNSHGEAVTLTKATGDMSVAQIGPFDDKWEPNTRAMQHAVSIAGTRLALGTWAGPRFTAVTVSARARPALYATLRQINVGDFFTLTGMAAAGYRDDLVMKVLQVKEEISQVDHRFTFTVRPGEIDYRLWETSDGVADGLMDDVIDLAASTVAVASSGTTVDVNVPTAKWSVASGSFDVMISGEQMTVTAVATLTSTTQRLTVTRSVNGVVKTVPVGAAVHVYPAYFIKAV